MAVVPPGGTRGSDRRCQPWPQALSFGPVEAGPEGSGRGHPDLSAPSVMGVEANDCRS